jgi:hypothetical protein
MATQKAGKFNWFNVVSLLWCGIGVVSICFAVFFIAFYDAPMGGKSTLGPIDYALITTVIIFPLVCIGSGIAIWFVKNKFKYLSICLSVIPVLPIILIFGISFWSDVSTCGHFNCQSSTTMQGQGNAIQAAKCVEPVIDGGDGLNTTGCGVLNVGVIGTGTTHGISDAQNWQFSTQDSNPIILALENDGSSCPQIRILGDSGSLVEPFKNENDTHCLTGMITTSYFHFVPPAKGTYIIRLVTPGTPGAYWIKIE